MFYFCITLNYMLLLFVICTLLGELERGESNILVQNHSTGYEKIQWFLECIIYQLNPCVLVYIRPVTL